MSQSSSSNFKGSDLAWQNRSENCAEPSIVGKGANCSNQLVSFFMKVTCKRCRVMTATEKLKRPQQPWSLEWSENDGAWTPLQDRIWHPLPLPGASSRRLQTPAWRSAPETSCFWPPPAFLGPCPESPWQRCGTECCAGSPGGCWGKSWPATPCRSCALHVEHDGKRTSIPHRAQCPTIRTQKHWGRYSWRIERRKNNKSNLSRMEIAAKSIYLYISMIFTWSFAWGREHWQRAPSI